MPSSKKCPLTRKACWGAECMWYMELRGKDAMTGEPVERGQCAITAQVLMAMDGNKLTNELASTVQGHRNEVGQVGQLLKRIPVKHADS